MTTDIVRTQGRRHERKRATVHRRNVNGKRDRRQTGRPRALRTASCSDEKSSEMAFFTAALLRIVVTAVVSDVSVYCGSFTFKIQAVQCKHKSHLFLQQQR